MEQIWLQNLITLCEGIARDMKVLLTNVKEKQQGRKWQVGPTFLRQHLGLTAKTTKAITVTTHMEIYCGLNIETHCFHVYVCEC